MKKVVCLLSIAGLLGVMGLTAKNNDFIETKAYDKAILPKNIDLNEVADDDIRSYYSELNKLSNTERTGTNLLKNLKPILSNNQKYYSYDVSSGKDIWKMYEITDRDWEKSPAPEIEGYDASSNMIIGYTYGDSASKPGSNPYIHALYVNRDVDNNVRAWAKTGTTSSHGGNNEWCIDREHIWPKSHGFEDNKSDPATSGARGDPMHLWAGDSYVNSALHSNYFYGYVDTTKTYTNGKDKYGYVSGNLMGTSKTKGGSVKVFEPQDSDKGDIARAVFYMVARYNFLSGSDSNGIENDNPNLQLVDNVTDWVESGYISTETKTGKLGILSDLLEWNKLDPVDEYEIKRNDLLYRNFTNNRNPFIDFPEWADYVWGEQAGSTSADPQVDAINNGAYAGEEITISKKTLSLDSNGEGSIVATSKDNSDIEWVIEDETVVEFSDKTNVVVKSNMPIRRRISKTVASGTEVKIRALKEGTTTITAKTTIDGITYEAKCTITVTQPTQSFDLVTFIQQHLWLVIIVGVVLVLVIILFIIFGSKKSKKKAKQIVKKGVKKATKSSSKKKK